MRSSSLYQHTAWPDGHEVAINYKEQLGHVQLDQIAYGIAFGKT